MIATAEMTKEWKKDFPFSKFPILERMFQQIEASNVNTESHNCTQGLELRFENEVNGVPNRGWLRVYFPMESKCILFFHKKSSVPFSRDRFSYGGVVIDERSTARFTDADLQEWIAFLQGGLQPKLRPATLKKSLPYTIPED